MLGFRWNLSICQFPVTHWTDDLGINMAACTPEGKWNSETERGMRDLTNHCSDFGCYSKKTKRMGG